MATKKWLNKNIFGMGSASLFSDASHEMITAILPLFLSTQLGAAAIALGIIEGVSDFSSSFVKSFSGWYSDKIGRRKPFITIGYILTGVCIPAIGLATSWVHVLFLKTIAWMGRGIRGPARDALLSDSINKKFRSHAFGFERMMDTMGAIIGPAVAFFALPLIGIRNIFIISAIPAILAVLSMGLIKDVPIKSDHKMKFIKTLKGMPKEFKNFLYAVGIFGIANFANTFLILRAMEALKPVNGELMAASIATGLYVLLNTGAAVFAYVFGALGDKTNKKHLVALGYIIFAFYCAGFIMLTPTVINFAFLFALAGVETGLIDVMERAYTADLVKNKLRGTAYGLLNTVNGIGDFASSIIAGLIWTAFSFKFAFLYGAVISVIAAVVLMGEKNK